MMGSGVTTVGPIVARGGNMELINDPEGTRELYALMNTYLQSRSRGDEIHVSDLESPLQAYWQRKCPDMPYTEREICLFLVGEGHHVFLVQAVAGVEGSQEDSFVDEATGIVYSPDLVAYNGEFKTSRWWEVPQDFEGTHTAVKWYYSQCKSYAAFMQDRLREPNTWKIVVLYVCPSHPGIKSKHPVLRQYKVRFTDEELEQHRRWMGERAELLRSALRDNTPKDLPFCGEGKCWHKVGHGRGNKATMEPTCRFFHVCRPAGRYQQWCEEHPEEMPNDVQSESK